MVAARGNWQFLAWKLPLQMVDDLLQILEILGGMTAIHLGMMELHGDGKPHLEPTFAIATPSQEGVIENTRVLVDDAVELGGRHGRGADNHRLLVERTFAGVDGRLRHPIVIGGKLIKIITIGHIARTDIALFVVHNHVNGQAVVLIQFFAFGQQIKHLLSGGSTAHTPAQQRVKLYAPALAHLIQTRYIKSLGKRNHGHRRLHPKSESLSPAGILRINFLFHCGYTDF